MRFLSRNSGGDKQPEPAWAGRLRGDDVQALIVLVRAALGPAAPQAEAFRTAPEIGPRYRLHDLATRVAGLPRTAWPKAIHDHLAAGDAMRRAGDAAEASAQTFAQARPYLRLVPMRPGEAPPGDVVVPSLVPEIVEVLAIDTGPSIRYVSERLASRWSKTVPELIATADEQIRRIGVDRSDRTSAGRPDVHAVYSSEPHSASFVRQFDHFVPSRGGILGTLIAIPARDGFLYRDLDPGSDLRGDLVDLAVLAIKTYEGSRAQVLAVPLWRRRDGTCRMVRLHFSDSGELLGSWDPAFDGVLTALDPRERLTPPAWASDLGPAEYTLFAGLVAAETAVWVEEVALLHEALDLATLLRRCLAMDDERWPDVIAEHFEPPPSPQRAASALLAHPEAALARVRSRLVVTLQTVVGVDSEADRRTTPLPGIVESLGLRLMGVVVPVSSDLAAPIGASEELYAEAERQTHAALRSMRATGGLSQRRFALEGAGAALGLLRIGEWSPDIRGPGGVMVSSSDDRSATIAPVDDILALFDLPALIATTTALESDPACRLPPTLVWDSPTGNVIAQLERDEDGVVRGGHVEGSVRDAARSIPMPALPPFQLEEIFPKRWQPFLRAFEQEFVQRVQDDLAHVTEIRGSTLREYAQECARLPEKAWPHHLRARFDEIAVRQARLDFLSISSTYEAARASLLVRVDRSPGMVDRRLPGGLHASLYLSNPPRYRPLMQATIARWDIDEVTCWGDAERNLVGLDDLVEEPIPGGHPSWHNLESPTVGGDAAALYLHRREPGTRNGFIVAITHRGRAEFIRLDDRGAAGSIAAFGQQVRAIFLRAREADDELSSSILWLRPDGSLLELYDALDPFPGLDRLPSDLVLVVRRDQASPFG